MNSKCDPLWSIVLPVYNCAEFLPYALTSVINAEISAQEAEILVVDDCSTDADVEHIVRQHGNGRTKYIRNPHNSGSSTANFNNCVRYSKGNLIHLLHGDDWVDPSFYTKARQALEDDLSLGMFFARSLIHDENGELISLTDAPFYRNCNAKLTDPSFLWYGNCIRTPSVVVRSSTYNRLGLFNENLRHAADWEMWERITGDCGAYFCNEALAHYRVFERNETGSFERSGCWYREWCEFAQLVSSRRKGFDGDRFHQFVLSHAKNQLSLYKATHDEGAATIARNILKKATPSRMPQLQRMINRLKSVVCTARR